MNINEKILPPIKGLNEPSGQKSLTEQELRKTFVSSDRRANKAASRIAKDLLFSQPERAVAHAWTTGASPLTAGTARQQNTSTLPLVLRELCDDSDLSDDDTSNHSTQTDSNYSEASDPCFVTATPKVTNLSLAGLFPTLKASSKSSASLSSLDGHSRTPRPANSPYTTRSSASPSPYTTRSSASPSPYLAQNSASPSPFAPSPYRSSSREQLSPSPVGIRLAPIPIKGTAQAPRQTLKQTGQQDF
jgi:hypothetical protein